MPIVPIDDPEDPRIALYRGVTDADLLGQHDLFVAEGRLVVRRLLSESPFDVVSVLVTEPARASISATLDGWPAVPVYVAAQRILNEIAGFNIHRGCLALGRRPPATQWPTCLQESVPPARVVVLEAVSNADNVGGIFRSAAALGAGAVLLARGCCDPLYRKAIRTSIGASLVLPFAWVDSVAGTAGRLRDAGYVVAALTPAAPATPIADVAAGLPRSARLAILAGAEGTGLSADALAAADLRVRIPMTAGVDSLNVAVAIGIALDRLRG